MTLYACVDCHTPRLHRPDREATLIEAEQWRAVQRCLDIWPVNLLGVDNPVDAARIIEREVNGDLKELLASRAAETTASVRDDGPR